MKLEKILKENWCRVTKERLGIFDYIQDNHLFNANDLITKFDYIGRASIFRTINLFLDNWIIRRINIWNKIETYEINDDNCSHEHMKCKKCNSIINFDSESICKNIFEKADELWFSISEHSIWVLWVCKSCK
jgi:Fur family ferric uptake transcriptional regulator